MMSSDSIKGMKRTCTLNYIKSGRKSNNIDYSYVLSVPITYNDSKHRSMISSFDNQDSIKKRIMKNNKKIHSNLRKRGASVGIDPGVRTFMTCFSAYEVYEFCNNAKEKLIKYYNKIDKAKKKHYKGTKILKRITSNGERKIKNYIKELHYKVACHLVKKYDNIYLGKINIKSILMNGGMSKLDKRVTSSLAHYRFRQILINQGVKYASKVTIVNEYLSSKMCSNCDGVYNVGTSKKYHCPHCGLHVGRDVNAAKNLLIRGKNGAEYINPTNPSNSG